MMTEENLPVALSIQQPWAWLIVNGYKDIENRSWNTNRRGRILIHAAKKFDHAGYEQAREILHRDYGIELPEPEEFQRGGIVGEAVIVDCVRRHSSIWFSGPFGFILSSARPCSFQPLRGYLNFFRVKR